MANGAPNQPRVNFVYVYMSFCIACYAIIMCQILVIRSNANMTQIKCFKSVALFSKVNCMISNGTDIGYVVQCNL